MCVLRPPWAKRLVKRPQRLSRRSKERARTSANERERRERKALGGWEAPACLYALRSATGWDLWVGNFGLIGLPATPPPFSLARGVLARSRSFLAFQHLAHGPEFLVAFFEQEFL